MIKKGLVLLSFILFLGMNNGFTQTCNSFCCDEYYQAMVTSLNAHIWLAEYYGIDYNPVVKQMVDKITVECDNKKTKAKQIERYAQVIITYSKPYVGTVLVDGWWDIFYTLSYRAECIITSVQPYL